MIKNIEFAYVTELRRDETRETAMRINLDMWLRPFEKEIDDQDGIVCVLFRTHDFQEFFILGISDSLYNRVKEKMNLYRPL